MALISWNYYINLSKKYEKNVKYVQILRINNENMKEL